MINEVNNQFVPPIVKPEAPKEQTKNQQKVENAVQITISQEYRDQKAVSQLEKTVNIDRKIPSNIREAIQQYNATSLL